jgi:aspartokinase/homoserine dehydrogenase 1
MVTEAFSDFVVGHGELWCALLLTATLRKMGVQSAFMDTRDVLVVTPTSDGNSVDVEYDASNERLDRWAQRHGSPAVRCLLLIP